MIEIREFYIKNIKLRSHTKKSLYRKITSREVSWIRSKQKQQQQQSNTTQIIHFPVYKAFIYIILFKIYFEFHKSYMRFSEPVALLFQMGISKHRELANQWQRQNCSPVFLSLTKTRVLELTGYWNFSPTLVSVSGKISLQLKYSLHHFWWWSQTKHRTANFKINPVFLFLDGFKKYFKWENGI